jgi:hypothetical protein
MKVRCFAWHDVVVWNNTYYLAFGVPCTMPHEHYQIDFSKTENFVGEVPLEMIGNKKIEKPIRFSASKKQ